MTKTIEVPATVFAAMRALSDGPTFAQATPAVKMGVRWAYFRPGRAPARVHVAECLRNLEPATGIGPVTC
jgi:hypothetical protein